MKFFVYARFFRDTLEYKTSVGKTILELSKVTPGGLLVFFPSYRVMNLCIEFWKQNDIWPQIEEQKPIILDSTIKKEFTAAMKQYKLKINQPNGKGAIFMAVLRGKVSEGLDFADMYGRAVMIVGIPFGPIKDPKVKLKKSYLDDNRTQENEMLSGNEWYTLDAINAVNQAIGRVIRHKNDFGAILLCDTRFDKNKTNISSWIKKHLTLSKSSENFDSMIRQLTKFFDDAEKTV